MQDLTKLTTPVGLLDEETRAALIAHGGPYEYWFSEGRWVTATGATPDQWRSIVFRVKAVPLTKPSINWDHVLPEYKWLARDSGGVAWLYSNKPREPDTNGTIAPVRAFSSYSPGTCDWKDSLVERPK